MSKSFVVQLRKTGLAGPINVSSNIITITGVNAGTILPTDFKDNAISGLLTSDIDRQITLFKTPGRPVSTSVNLNYALSANVGSVNEGGIVRFTLTTTGIEAGSILNFTITGINAADISIDNVNSLTGSFTVNSTGVTYKDIVVLADGAAEGSETMTMSIDGISPVVSTSVVINDTSTTSIGNARMSVGGFSGPLTGSAILPKAETWLMFRITGAGGSGGGSNVELSGSNGGAGGAGVTVRGLVKLPRTENNKILIGGIGIGGSLTNGINSTSISPGLGYAFGTTDYISFSGIGGSKGLGKSSSGGNGGGSTALGFAIQGTSPFSIIPIAAAGGGGGGGGASLEGAGGPAQIGNIQPKDTETLTNITGQDATSSLLPNGGGGGGGGGAAGTAGNASMVGALISTGGSTGVIMKNTSRILAASNWSQFEVITANSMVDISTVSNAAANTKGYFGSGSIGGTNMANGFDGAQGAIAVYWTTDVTAPTNWNLIPEYLEPNIIVLSTRSITTQPGTDSYIKFNSDGTITSSELYGPGIWCKAPHANIGNIYQIRVTRQSGNANLLSPLNGLGSNLGQWLDLSTAREFYLKTGAGTNQANLRIEIRGAISQTVFANVHYEFVSRSAGNSSVGTGSVVYTIPDFNNPGLLLFKAFDQVMGGNARDLFVDIIEGDDYSNRIPLEGQSDGWDVEQIGLWTNLNCIVYDDDQIDPNATFVQLCRFVDNFTLAQDAMATWADVVDQANQDLGLWNSLDQRTQDYYDPILNAVAQREAELGELGINTSLFAFNSEGYIATGSTTETKLTGTSTDVEDTDNSNLYGFNVGKEYQADVVQVTFSNVPNGSDPPTQEEYNRTRDQSEERLRQLQADLWADGGGRDESVTDIDYGINFLNSKSSVLSGTEIITNNWSVTVTGRIRAQTDFFVQAFGPGEILNDPAASTNLSNNAQNRYSSGNEVLDRVRREMEDNYWEARGRIVDFEFRKDGGIGVYVTKNDAQIIEQFRLDLVDRNLIYYDDGTLNYAATMQWLVATGGITYAREWFEAVKQSFADAVETYSKMTEQQWEELEYDERRTLIEMVQVAPYIESVLYIAAESAGIQIYPEGYIPDKLYSFEELRAANDQIGLETLQEVDRYIQELQGGPTSLRSPEYWQQAGIEEEILSKNQGLQTGITTTNNVSLPTVYDIQQSNGINFQTTSQDAEVAVSGLDQVSNFDELFLPASLDLAGTQSSSFSVYLENVRVVNEKGDSISDIIGINPSNNFDFGTQGGVNTIGTAAYLYQAQIDSGSTFIGTGAAAVPMDPNYKHWLIGGISDYGLSPTTIGQLDNALFVGYVGDGQYGGSVYVLAHMPGTDKCAGNMQPGDPLTLLNSDRTGTLSGSVVRNRISRQKLITLVSESGIELTLSDNTPITLEDGSYINSLDAFGHKLPVLDDAGFRWEMIIDVRDLGPGLVATIYCEDQCYAAGDQPGRYIITHNIDYLKPA